MDVTSGLTLSVAQVAERLALTPRHVRDLLNTGAIPGFKRGLRSWGVLISDLEAWIKNHCGKTPIGTRA